MIAHLRGRVLNKQPQELCLDVSGVGYRVQIPLSTFYRLPELGSETALHVHTHVREDVLALFGFLTREEQEIFERLIGVSGVGPRLALAILSGIEVPELVGALGVGDVARLTRIPGVGKKTAERLVLELRDKVATLAMLPAASVGARPNALQDDVLSALGNLGYPRALAERAVERAAREQPDARFEDLLRLALRVLAGG